jgi:ATP-binding cassette subfamily B protein
MIFSVSPAKFIFEYLATVMDSVFMVLSIYTMRLLFDRVEQWMRGETALPSVFHALMVFALVKICDEVFDGAANLIGEHYAALCSKKVLDMIHRKVANYRAECFEDHQFLSALNRATLGANDIRRFVHVVFDIVFLYVPFFTLITVMYGTTDLKLVSIIPLLFIPVLLSTIVKAKNYESYHAHISEIEMREAHFVECLTAKTYVKDIRNQGTSGFFISKLTEALSQKDAETVTVVRKNLRIEILANSISVVGIIGVLALLYSELINGSLSIAVFSAYVASIFEVHMILNEIFNNRLGELAKSSTKINAFYGFINRKDEQYLRLPQHRKMHAIRFNNVSFHYPNAHKAVLNTIDITLEQGKSYALVGVNGSGKSTFSKLLMGLYAPSVGSIDAIPSAGCEVYPPDARVTCVFQDFRSYCMSLQDNITLSDSGKPVDPINVRTALELSGFYGNEENRKIQLEDVLGREFGGRDFSVGEWQKIAIARAVYRDHDILVLDEPTAAIDPFEESRLYDTFFKLAKGITSLIITHRLGAARLADEILVMQNGRVIDAGGHDVLMSRCANYRELWSAQSKQFQELKTQNPQE